MENDQIGVIESFTDEHKALRRALSVLRTMTDQAERGTPVDRHDINALLVFLHYFGDVLHQAKEESILFPALKSSDEFTFSSELELLLSEHTIHRGLIEKVQFALFTDQQEEFIVGARKVADLLSEHADKEERVLFPLANRILRLEKAVEIAAKLEEADARFGFRQLTLLMDMLLQLESKYMPKAA
jgi:hemerythrin-like domain-containing protein